MTNGAYVMLNINPEYDKTVCQKLANLHGVKNFRPVMGRYNVILYTEHNTPEDVRNFVMDKIRTIKGVTETETCWCIPAHNSGDTLNSNSLAVPLLVDRPALAGYGSL